MLNLFITSKTRRKIITAFTKYPDLHSHVRGLAKMVKEDPGNVQRELVRLHKIGFVSATAQGNTKIYQANPRFMFYKELQSMVLKTHAKGARL